MPWKKTIQIVISIFPVNLHQVLLLLILSLFCQFTNVVNFEQGSFHKSGKKGFGFGSSKLEPPSRPNSYWDDPKFRPYFDDKINRNVTVQLGKTAYLHCKIRQLGDRTVSWVRQRDLHILTVGRYTYTSDQRFTCIHLDESDDWTLEIKYVQSEDAGVYECQISTEPKMSFSIKLNVVAAKAVIPEGPRVYAEAGDTINLTCLINESASPPLFVFWYHEGRVINYDSPRRGIRVTTDRGPTAVSRLQISDAKPKDSGDYSCKPSFADFVNVSILVTNDQKRKKDGDEKPKALHHGQDGQHKKLGNSSQCTTHSYNFFSPTLWMQILRVLCFLYLHKSKAIHI